SILTLISGYGILYSSFFAPESPCSVAHFMRMPWGDVDLTMVDGCFQKSGKVWKATTSGSWPVSHV
ncbi:MAG: hypothetical protein B7Z37_02075, partial [Verrucomicrobia bacterium 12-59-8]